MTRRKLELAWAEARASEEARSAERDEARRMQGQLEARLREALEEGALMRERCQRAEALASEHVSRYEECERERERAAQVSEQRGRGLGEALSQRRGYATNRALAAIFSRERAACASAYGTWRMAVQCLQWLEVLNPMQRQLRSLQSLADKRAEKARSALRADVEAAKAEAAHAEELRQVERKSVMHAKREYAERQRRAAAEHASKVRERALVARQQPVAAMAAAAAVENLLSSGTPEQLGALTAAVGVFGRVLRIRICQALCEWRARSEAIGEIEEMAISHSRQLAEVSEARRQMATALLDAEAARKAASSLGAASARKQLIGQLAAARACNVLEHAERFAVAASFGVWCRAVVASSWAGLTAAVDRSHLASTLKLSRRVGGLASAAALNAYPKLFLSMASAALWRWHACASFIVHSEEGAAMQYRLEKALESEARARRRRRPRAALSPSRWPSTPPSSASRAARARRWARGATRPRSLAARRST